MDISEQMKLVVAEFEAECGEIPVIESVEALYAGYTNWAIRRGEAVRGIGEFVRSIARRGYMPVRLPDGSIGFFGIALKNKELIQTGRYQ